MIKKLIFILITAMSYGQGCESKFWTIDSFNNIREWYLNSNVVSGGNVILTPNFSVLSLAYDGVTHPTFICGNNTKLSKYDSFNGWTNLLSATYVNNGGSYNNNHYFHNSTTGISYYNGVNVSNFNATNSTNPYFTVADTAVDSQGRAWVFTGSIQGTLNTSALSVYNGNNLVESYTASFISQSAYGAFFLNDILYILIGSDARQNPNTIIPININGSIATLGTPISFSCPDCHDAASCNVNQLALNEININPDFTISPNPTDGIINIYSKVQIKESQVFSIDGRLILDTNQNIIDLSDVSNGLYLVKTLTIDNKLYTKLIKKN